MRDTLLTRGMIGEYENLDDFLAVWNALEGEGTNVALFSSAAEAVDVCLCDSRPEDRLQRSLVVRQELVVARRS